MSVVITMVAIATSDKILLSDDVLEPFRCGEEDITDWLQQVQSHESGGCYGTSDRRS